MKLESITLTNFRQFYGDQTLKLARDPTKNVTVISGVNGAGKTTLLAALNWCLYQENASAAGELVNKRALTETPVGFSVEAKVQVVFSHEGERYTVVRAQRANRISDSEWNREQPSFSVSRIRADGQFETVHNPAGAIESILPSSVSAYFFFDGEKIDKFARPGHEDEVRSAVKQVLKIEVLERARNHLAAVAREYRQELGSHASGELNELLQREAQLRDKLGTNKSDLETLRSERAAAERQLKDIDGRLAELTAVRELVAKRGQLQGDLTAREADRDRLWDDVRGIVHKGFIPLACKAMEQAGAILDEKRRRGEIPPGIREQFLQDLLTRGRCICGRPIGEDSKERRALLTLLAAAVPSELENVVLRTAGDLRALDSLCRRLPLELRDAMRKKVAIDDDIERLEQELDDLSRKLADFDQEDVGTLERKRRDLCDALVRLAGEIGRAETLISELHTQLEAVEADISKAQVRAQHAKRVWRRFTLASKAASALDKICDAFAADMRQQIREEAKKIFDTLIWKSSQFRDISISDDYHLEVLDRWGFPARPELSAGERQVLSLAFICGMSKVTGEEAPLVMDTPFARLSTQHRENIATQVPRITKQLVLLVTDEELHSRARDNLAARIGAEYELVFDQSTGCTSVRFVR